MACDLSDPSIMRAYEKIISMQDTINWFILGYHDTRNKISLYSKGSGGLDEFGQNLKEILIILIACGLVQGRVVAALFKMHQMQTTREEVSENHENPQIILPTVYHKAAIPSPSTLHSDNNESEQQIKDNYN
ncbi:14253_t:CDS:2, partial [Ambispora leptoticha]